MKHLLVPLPVIMDTLRDNLSVVSGKGSSQLVGLVRVVQLVKLYLITLNLRGVMWKGLSQLVRVVQLVKLRIIMETYSPFER